MFDCPLRWKDAVLDRHSPLLHKGPLSDLVSCQILAVPHSRQDLDSQSSRLIGKGAIGILTLDARCAIAIAIAPKHPAAAPPSQSRTHLWGDDALTGMTCASSELMQVCDTLPGGKRHSCRTRLMCERTCFFWYSSLSCVSTSSLRRSETLIVLHLAAAWASCAERITLQGRGRSLTLNVCVSSSLVLHSQRGLQFTVQGSFLGEQSRAQLSVGSRNSHRHHKMTWK